MEGLARLIRYSLNTSMRGLIRWTDMLILPRGFPDYTRALVPAAVHGFPSHQLPSVRELEDNDNGEGDEDGGTNPKSWSGFLWGVPKKRTSQMKRLRRKFGHQDYQAQCRLLKPKTNLRICDTCGHHYEAFHLCGHCYDRISKETNLIREQADAKFGHGPHDKDIVVLYESEKHNAKEKNIVIEFPKPRPSFFSANLLQRSTLGINPDAKSLTPQALKPIVVDTKKE